jgi:hypothetical protein
MEEIEKGSDNPKTKDGEKIIDFNSSIGVITTNSKDGIQLYDSIGRL